MPGQEHERSSPDRSSPDHGPDGPRRARGRLVSRRTLFRTGGAVLGGAALAAVGTGLATVERPAPLPQRVPASARPRNSPNAEVTVEWVRSATRGRSVRLLIASPPDRDRTALPVCLGLHGLGGNALWWGDTGMRRQLGSAWDDGTAPFTVVAVDGGDNYWLPYGGPDDPMRMLLEEVPLWMAERGLDRGGDGLPALAAGVSMGGTGALMYARERVRLGVPVRAAAALSPGLFLDWATASQRPYRDPAYWAAHDPLRFHPEIAGVPVGLWCGDRDSFAPAARRYIEVARPAFSRISAGRHNGAYYSRVLPEMIGFLGLHSGALPAPFDAAGEPFPL